MSQDNENKPDDLNFDFLANADDQKLDTENPFADAGFSFPDAESVAEVPGETPIAEQPVQEGLDLSAPSPFLSGESEVAVTDTETEATTESQAEATVVEVADPKGKKKKKEKEKKPKPEKKKKEKKERQPGDKMELSALLSLAFGGVLLLALIAVNVLLIVTSPYKEFGVGFTSIIYYLVGVDVIGGIGIVAVPFLFYVYQKDIDVFKVLLGVSTMTLSLSVILLMTAFLRYDFSTKPTSSVPQLVKPNLTQEAAPAQ